MKESARKKLAKYEEAFNKQKETTKAIRQQNEILAAKLEKHTGPVISAKEVERLRTEGALIHYDDNPDAIPTACRDQAHTLVVYTPAIPAEHRELTWFRANGFEVQKRAEVLGTLTRSMKGLCVAGTHGKTTTTAMAAHILHDSHVGCNAFLGGITKNYGTNYLVDHKSPYVVIEADEFDRSFHHLRPYATVITATDPDHLDIYGTKEAYLESFRHYTSLVRPDGVLICHRDLELHPDPQPGVRCFRAMPSKSLRTNCSPCVLW